MAFELQNQIENWRLRLQASGAWQFVQWWKSELTGLLPPEVQARMQHANRRVVVQVTDNELEVSSFEGQQMQMLDAYSLGQDAATQRQQIADALLERDLHEVPRDILLPADSVLTKKVTVPLAAESNLRQALAFEMDRHTPFRAEQVYFDYRILSRDKEAGQTQLELIVMPRSEVDGQIETLRPRGMAPSGADVLHDGVPAGLNLLPVEQRYRMTNRRSRINSLMAVAAVVLLAVVMAQSLWLRQHQISQVEEAIETVRVEARLVQGLRSQIEDASEAAGFMASQRIESAPAIGVLAEVTTLLPDDTYLDRLRIWDGQIQIQGKSANAQQLIELVNSSGMFENAAFRGPTRLDSRSGREIFDLGSNLTREATP